MKDQPNLLLGRIAVERGWLKPEQLTECLRDQAAAPAPIGAVMLRKGFLQQSQLEALLEEQGRRLCDVLDLSDPTAEDALLGRLLIRQGLATEKQVYECLRLQAETAEAGKPPMRLGEILVHKNYIASDAMDTDVLLTKRVILSCPSCQAHYSTLGANPAKNYPCKKCGRPLQREERLLRPGETTGSLRIDLPEDVVQHARHPERRFAGGKYILVQEAGRGGMGVVWKAWQTDLKRYVAIKILSGNWTEQDLKRFHREAQLAAQLSHSNIASIYEVGADGGRHFISMEFVDGEPLSHLVSAPTRPSTQRRHVNLRHAVEIVREAALAVEYAHSKGLIHRDLKPSNIMVNRQGGRTYVMDFGLARPVRSQDSLTLSDAILGTPSYMSPEQARGESSLDRRGDVYSLGAVLYSVLTGRPPFSGQSAAETLMKVIADDPVPPRQVNPRVHVDLETICLKALEKDRRRRYESAQTFADDLTRYLEGEPISARPLSWREQIWRTARHRPITATLVAGAFATGMLVLLTVLYLQGRTSRRVDDYLREGNEHFDREEYAAALGKYDQALTLHPSSEIARLRKQECEQALRDRSQGPAAQVASLRSLADALYDAGAFTPAAEEYRKILRLDSQNVWATERRRSCETEIEAAAARERERTNALAKAKEIAENDLLQSERRLRAMAHYQTGRAAADAAGRLKAVPDILRKYREAAESLTRALQEDDGYGEAGLLRGCVRFRMADFEGADQDFRRTPSLAAASFQSALLQAVRFQLHSRAPYVKNAEEVKGALAQQQQAAERTLNLVAPAYERWGAKALLHLHGRRFDEALEALDRIRTEGSGQYSMALLRALIHLEAGNDAQALPGLIAAIELEPASYEALYLRALLRDRRDELDAALEDAHQVLEIAPENYLSYLLRAHLHHRRGDRRRALADLERASQIAGAPREEIQGALASLQRDSDP